jgi:Uma2 family endonuclease
MARSAISLHRYTVDEYLRRERDSVEKHEFDDGRIIALAGGTRRHALIAANTLAALHGRLKGTPCLPYGSDLRIRVAGRPKYVYPDVSVICGEAQADPEDPHGESFLNPRLIVEVLSPSTEKRDRGPKFDCYREMPSFREYVLIEQDAPRVELSCRHPDGTWLFDVAVGIEAVARLRSMDIDLPLAELYANAEFPAALAEPDVAGDE